MSTPENTEPRLLLPLGQLFSVASTARTPGGLAPSCPPTAGLLPCLGAAQGKGEGAGAHPSGPAPTPPYPLADEQAVGVLDGGSLMQQQRLELAFLNVVEGVEHHSQKL